VDSTTGRTFGARHSCGSRIGGMAPPGIARVWPHGAHRAFLGSSSPKPATGLRTSRATVSPITDFAPASSSAREQASSVAPVVITSSTSKTRRLSTWVPGRVAKAPRSDSQPSSRLSTRLSGRGRVRQQLLANPARRWQQDTRQCTAELRQPSSGTRSCLDFSRH